MYITISIHNKLPVLRHSTHVAMVPAHDEYILITCFGLSLYIQGLGKEHLPVFFS